MSKFAKLFIISVVFMFLATTFVSAGLFNIITGRAETATTMNKLSDMDKLIKSNNEVTQPCKQVVLTQGANKIDAAGKQYVLYASKINPNSKTSSKGSFTLAINDPNKVTPPGSFKEGDSIPLDPLLDVRVISISNVLVPVTKDIKALKPGVTLCVRTLLTYYGVNATCLDGLNVVAVRNDAVPRTIWITTALVLCKDRCNAKKACGVEPGKLSPIYPGCVGEGGSIGGVSPENKLECCPGLDAVVPEGRVGGARTCAKTDAKLTEFTIETMKEIMKDLKCEAKGARRCNNNAVQICSGENDKLAWTTLNGGDCTKLGKVCAIRGAGLVACSPKSEVCATEPKGTFMAKALNRCNGDVKEKCDEAGKWIATETCTAGQTCGVGTLGVGSVTCKSAEILTKTVE